MSAVYVVLATAEDGSESAWGPFSEARADLAVVALQHTCADHVRALPLLASARLTEELPDWRRVLNAEFRVGGRA